METSEKNLIVKKENRAILENENGFSIWNNSRQLTNVPFKK